MKLSTKKGQLAVSDYFNMYNTVSESDVDEDLGSGRAMVVPNFVDSKECCINWLWAPERIRISMWRIGLTWGSFNPNNNSQIYQEVNRCAGGSVFRRRHRGQTQITTGGRRHDQGVSFNTSGLLNSTPASATSTKFSFPGLLRASRGRRRAFDFVGDGNTSPRF